MQTHAELAWGSALAPLEKPPKVALANRSLTRPMLSSTLPDMATMSPYRSAQRRAKVIKLSAEGKTGSDIARRLGITRQRVQQIRDAENVQRLDKPHVARRKLIRGLIAEGMCGADMARQLDCSVDCIYADIRSLKLTTPEKAQLMANRSRAQSDAKKAAARKRLRGKMK